MKVATATVNEASSIYSGMYKFHQCNQGKFCFLQEIWIILLTSLTIAKVRRLGPGTHSLAQKLAAAKNSLNCHSNIHNIVSNNICDTQSNWGL